MAILFKDILKTKIYSSIVNFLKEKYNKSNTVFSNADPYGQLVELQAELQSTNMAYIDKAIRALDINDPANNNTKMIRSIARLANHDAVRARSATGTIMLKYKVGVDITSSIPGGEIIIKDSTQLKCISNNKTYSINLGVDSLKYNMNSTTDVIYLNIVQGIYTEKGFTGTGLENQSFSIQSDNINDIEQNNYKLSVGGEVWGRVSSKIDMLPNEKVYYARTGIDSSLDIYTGNSENGSIPQSGSPIVIKYLISEGKSGNISNSAVNDFKFIDDILDSFGNPIDIENIFDIHIFSDINFGADGETVELTKSLIPNITNNNIMMLPKHYEFYFKRLNLFSIVRAFKGPSIDQKNITDLINILEKNTAILKQLNDTNSSDLNLKNLVKNNLNIADKSLKVINSISHSDIVNILLVPDIRKYYNSNLDYFSIPQSAFILDDTKIEKLKSIITDSNIQTLSSEFVIIKPVPIRYVTNVIVRLYNDAIDTNVKSNIQSIFSDYMLNNKRYDRIPPSDLISLVEGLYDVDSADVSFINELNEKYHLEYNNLSIEFQLKYNRLPKDNEIIMTDGTLYDKNRIIYLDSVLGDAKISNNEIFMLRGGWYDRNNNYYADNANNSGYCSLNIIFTNERTKR